MSVTPVAYLFTRVAYIWSKGHDVSVKLRAFPSSSNQIELLMLTIILLAQKINHGAYSDINKFICYRLHPDKHIYMH